MNAPSVGEVLWDEFTSYLGISRPAPPALMAQVSEAIAGLRSDQLRPQPDRQRALFSLVSFKLQTNQRVLREVASECENFGVHLNYHDRIRLQALLDQHDADGFAAWVLRFGLGKDADTAIGAFFRPVPYDEVRDVLVRELDADPRHEEIIAGLFGGYVFESFGRDVMYRHFNPDCRAAYFNDFWDHIQRFYHEAIHRERGMELLVLDEELFRRFSSYDEFLSAVFSSVERAHRELSNHCYLSVLVRPFGTRALQWRIYSDLILFAEKHSEVPLRKGYFHPAKIRDATTKHIPGLVEAETRFDLANEGFFYRDCFVVQGATPDGIDLLVLFEKNERYEVPIPCPACRSLDVQGNSYPVLGVRSWECNNQVCPERSKYNRGNRYSLQSLQKQAAIERPENAIPLTSIRQWKLDVATVRGEGEILDLLLRHYSLVGDTVLITNGETLAHGARFGRQLEHQPFSVGREAEGRAGRFFDSHFFRRYKHLRPQASEPGRLTNLSKDPLVEVYHGDAWDVLRGLASDSVNGSVTSPPYYNAREYSTWPNIYCYLYDMYNIAAEVYRVLKPGSFFLYNIFDYFDNENNIVFSAMGKKRMILGAYIIDMFEDLGFQLCGNTIWNKGEIEGKRVFNQGNMSPYYQTPLNCWEHVLIFSKGEPVVPIERFPQFLNEKPVMKMVRGQNILGHTAPFPAAIPRLLLHEMKPGQVVLDPFSGSMTTGIAARRRGIRSISIDRLREYCDLGLQRLNGIRAATGAQNELGL